MHFDKYKYIFSSSKFNNSKHNNKTTSQCRKVAEWGGKGEPPPPHLNFFYYILEITKILFSNTNISFSVSFPLPISLSFENAILFFSQPKQIDPPPHHRRWAATTLLLFHPSPPPLLSSFFSLKMVAIWFIYYILVYFDDGIAATSNFCVWLCHRCRR